MTLEQFLSKNTEDKIVIQVGGVAAHPSVTIDYALELLYNWRPERINGANVYFIASNDIHILDEINLWILAYHRFGKLTEEQIKILVERNPYLKILGKVMARAISHENVIAFWWDIPTQTERVLELDYYGVRYEGINRVIDYQVAVQDYFLYDDEALKGVEGLYYDPNQEITREGYTITPSLGMIVFENGMRMSVTALEDILADFNKLSTKGALHVK